MSSTKQRKFRIPFFSSLFEKLAENKVSFIAYLVIASLVIVTLIRMILAGNRQSHITASILAFLMLLIPAAVKVILRIRLTPVLEILAYVFIFSSEILGEVHSFYGVFPFWDGWLHVISGVMFAAFGFCLVDVFGKNKESRFSLPPLFLALIAFCFSMTVGVFWEFIEFSGDMLFNTDMQKDYILNELHTFYLPPTHAGSPVAHYSDIAKMVLYDSAGNPVVTTPGYMDIGIVDSIKDMALNALGAVLFCVIGYLNVRGGGKGRLANLFIPSYVGAESPAPATQPRSKEQSYEEQN
jgi:hypothetical protein